MIRKRGFHISVLIAYIVEFVEHLEIYYLVAKPRKRSGRKIPLDKLLKKEGVEA